MNPAAGVHHLTVSLPPLAALNGGFNEAATIHALCKSLVLNWIVVFKYVDDTQTGVYVILAERT